MPPTERLRCRAYCDTQNKTSETTALAAYGSYKAQSPLLPKSGDGIWHIDTVRWPAGMRDGGRISDKHIPIPTMPLS